jgi:putative ABC transport system ATP-binding protein
MADAIISAAGLERRYQVGRQSVTALAGLDLAINQGEWVAITGPSGCGKSTLLNLLGGLDRPTAGKVWLAGHDLAEYSEEQLAGLRRETLGFVFQRHDLFPVLTAQENVEFPMLLGKVARGERQARALELLRVVGLEAKAGHLPDELLGGEQQRVGIARALANSPKILLADEPTGNLDSVTAAEIMQRLVELTRKLGLTLIVVTHDPEVAMQADRILVMKDGHFVNGNGQIQ